MRITKEWNRVLRWLLKAVPKARENLSVVHVEDDINVTCDGFRLHAVRGYGLPEGDWVLSRFTAIDSEVQAKQSNVTFPDYQQAIPHEKPLATIAVSPKFLKEAVSVLDGEDVVLNIHEHTLEILGFSGALPVYALIARRKLEPTTAPIWKPTRRKNNGEV